MIFSVRPTWKDRSFNVSSLFFFCTIMLGLAVIFGFSRGHRSRCNLFRACFHDESGAGEFDISRENMSSRKTFSPANTGYLCGFLSHHQVSENEFTFTRHDFVSARVNPLGGYKWVCPSSSGRIKMCLQSFLTWSWWHMHLTTQHKVLHTSTSQEQHLKLHTWHGCMLVLGRYTVTV